MRIITSWLKVNRSFGVAVLLTALFCCVIALGTSSNRAGTAGPAIPAPSCTASAVFSASFTQGAEASELVKHQWVDFRGSLVPANYDTVNISGTFDSTGLTIHDSVVVPQIATALKNAGAGSWTVSGVTYNVGYSGSSDVENPGTEINANTNGSTATNSCPNPGWIVRPNLGNESWGGANTETCGARSQTLTVTFSGSGAPSCAPAPAGMVSWWKAEGNANDSADSNDGTLQGGAGFATGEVGQGFSLNGTDQYVEVPSSPNLEAITTAITVDAWINPSDVSIQRAIVSKYNNNDTNGRSWFLGIDPGGDVVWVCRAA